jgi:hypothetical protein
LKNIVTIRFGSHLYGTSTPTSDLDYKSVFLPPGRDILLQRAKASVNNKRPKQLYEKNVAGEIDEESFALHRYLSLLAEGQTVAMDMLFAPRWAMEHDPSPLWDELVANSSLVVTRRASSFVGYCRTQANRYGIRGSRVHAVRNIVEWFDAAIAEFGATTRLLVAADSLPAFIADKALEHTAIVYIPHPSRPDPIPHLECCGRKTPYFSSLKDARAVFARVFDEYGHRALQAEKNEGIDWKALSHAVRVGHEAMELLTTGRITFPLTNAAHILEIKLGQLPYAEVAAEIESLLEAVIEAEPNSLLREKPDHDFIDDFVARAYRAEVVG